MLTDSGLNAVLKRFAHQRYRSVYFKLSERTKELVYEDICDEEASVSTIKRFFRQVKGAPWVKFDTFYSIYCGLWYESSNPPSWETLVIEVDSKGNVINSSDQIESAFRWSKNVKNPLLQSPYVANEFKDIIQEKTQNFVGRGYVRDAFKEFSKASASGYFVLKGEPGEGKSTIVAEFCKKQPCLLYFNSFAYAFVRPDQFLKSVCRQLIEQFQLKEYADISKWPEDALSSGGFLLNLLNRASEKLPRDQKLVIFIDALDEYDLDQQPAGNILFLPENVPDKVYFFLTYRRENKDSTNIEERFKTSTNPKKHNLADFPGSYDDIGLYVRTLLAQPVYQESINLWLKRRNKKPEQLVEQLKTLSDRNFMFISYVMKELCDPSGLYADQEFEALPSGLKNYYNTHWARMRPNEAGCRILAQVCNSPGPLTVQEIAIRSGQKPFDVLTILQQWSQFFPPKTLGGQRLYSLYHDSYRKYLFDERDEIKLFIGDERDANDDALENML